MKSRRVSPTALDRNHAKHVIDHGRHAWEFCRIDSQWLDTSCLMVLPCDQVARCPEIAGCFRLTPLARFSRYRSRMTFASWSKNSSRQFWHFRRVTLGMRTSPLGVWNVMGPAAVLTSWELHMGQLLRTIIVHLVNWGWSLWWDKNLQNIFAFFILLYFTLGID